ncbi:MULTISPECIES: intradiol ring-cleavage dioxygenase [Streptacidiphilus]|uniref:Intradiol ring-cleavage dioxygenase n=1 Tax=Streptacidiphilus cavernicola TaxID=3342716 RepID=A0ABV6UJP6_9ACTN|nr:intradiol ring-cleavage dioxygenase [Streptacidiphilus jeojiense]
MTKRQLTHTERTTASVPTSRRKILTLGGAGIALGAAGLAAPGALDSAFAAEAEQAGDKKGQPKGPATTCALTEEVTEGPYYIDDEAIRSDVTEDRTGVPLRLRLTVLDTEHCRPLRNAAVEIWHCDATGDYSGFIGWQSLGGGGGGAAPTGTPPTGAPPTGSASDSPSASDSASATSTDTAAASASASASSSGGPGTTTSTGGSNTPTDEYRWLRGVLFTNEHGQVEFKTIYPGWYIPRAIHIHVKVHTGGQRVKRHYIGGTSVHTGQLFFPEEVTTVVAASDPYVTHTAERTVLSEDMVYDGGGVTSGLLTVVKRTNGRHHSEWKLSDGYLATLDLGVTTSTSSTTASAPAAPSASATASATTTT